MSDDNLREQLRQAPAWFLREREADRAANVVLWAADSRTGTSTTVDQLGAFSPVFLLHQVRSGSPTDHRVLLSVDELRTLLPVLAAAVEQYDREARA